MAEIKKARRGYRAHLTKLLQNVEALLRLVQPLTEGGSIALRDTLHKETLIAALDAKILELLVNNEEVEAKVLQAEEIHSLISTVKAKITHRFTPLATPTYMDHTVQNLERAVTTLFSFPSSTSHTSLETLCTGSPSGIPSKPQWTLIDLSLVFRNLATLELNSKGKHKM